MDPILEIKHLLTGLVLGVSLVGPIMFWRYWRLKRRGAAAIEQATAKGKHDAKTERVKSDIIISAIEDGVVVVGADKVINVFNQGAAKMTGWPSEEAEGLEYHSVFYLWMRKVNRTWMNRTRLPKYLLRKKRFVTARQHS